MAKSLFEQLGGTYHSENGYLIPNLKLPTVEEQPVGLYGQRHLQYLKQYHKGTYRKGACGQGSWRQI
ncbi:MAG: TnpV protein [Lachnospiraceae bacterium]|nr:TnpV protein [Lachnospiraceae bacterium]